MNSGLRAFSAGAAVIFALTAAQANELIPVGLCTPLTTRYTKCVGDKLVQCTRSRGISCKTKVRCLPTSETCDLAIQTIPQR